MQYLQRHPRHRGIQMQWPKHHPCSISHWLTSWPLQTWPTPTAATVASGLQRSSRTCSPFL